MMYISEKRVNLTKPMKAHFFELLQEFMPPYPSTLDVFPELLVPCLHAPA